MAEKMRVDQTEDLPAIAGGRPAKQTPFEPLVRYGAEELAQLKEALEQNTLFYSQGSKVRQMEQEVARISGVEFAVATSSGTASIHAAMIAAGVSPGDEVITSPITDMGSLVPILFQGGVPVFADLHPRSYVMDPGSVESLITERTRAVLAVNLWGNACDLAALKAICARRGITLIEDCAQAWGATYEGKSVGTVGEIGCFSLNEFKHVSCGDGGVVIARDKTLAKRLRLATDKGYDRDPDALLRNASFLCGNYRLTELQGAVALAQLGKLESIVARRRKWCEALSERLAGVKGITLPEPTPGCNPSWWFYMMRAQPEVLGVDTDRFGEALKAEGLPVGLHYIGRCCYEYPIFVDHSAFAHAPHPFAARTYGKGLCPEAEAILETCVMFSAKETFNETDLDEFAHAISRVAAWFVAGNK